MIKKVKGCHNDLILSRKYEVFNFNGHLECNIL